VIIAAAVAAYHNTFDGPFVFDDASSIVTNPTIRRWWPLTELLAGPVTNVTAQGRPLLNLSLAINYALGGTAVQGYHLVNLLIHTCAGLALFGIVRRTVMRRQFAGAERNHRADSGQPETLDVTREDNAMWFAAAVAVLWTVHPLQTESVTYVIQRAESLVGLFYLLTLYCFVRAAGLDGLGVGHEILSGSDGSTNSVAAGAAARRKQASRVPVAQDEPALIVSAATQADNQVRAAAFRPFPRHRAVWFALSVLACLLGMATKEVMVTAPLMVLFFDRTFFAGTFRGAWRRRRGYYVALAGTWLLLGWLIAQTGGNRGGSVGFGVSVGWWDYWLTQFKAIGRYLWLSFWPHPLAFEYGSFWIHEFGEIAVEVGLVLGLLAATIIALRRRSATGFIGAWFFGILAPTSLAPGTTQMIVEHRMYLPLAAVIALVVGTGHAWFAAQRRAALTWILGAVAVALVLLTMRRNEDYRSDIALWTDTIAKRPDNPLAQFMLAGAQERGGDGAAALVSYERTLELKPDFSIGHENLGELLLRQGRRAEAMAHFESALRLQPDYADAHANLGNAYLADGRIAEAVRHLERAVQLTPESASVRYNFGNALAAAGLPAEAATEFEAALKLQPTMAEAHFNLANALMELRRPNDAIRHYEAATKARPDYAAAHYNLANVLAASGRQPEAIGHYEAALRARPDYPEAHHNLGSALFELGRLAEAAQQYEATLRLAPEFPNARENLERVRAKMKEK
jgi:tetratricopeptide (TPR) repeat protein